MAEPTSTQFLDTAHGAIGDPYQFGAAGPGAFDCSGLVYWALRKVGINFPRTSEEQYAAVQHISASELQPGDLIFEQWPGDQAAPGHVVIWLGNGKIEQAPSTGQLVQTDSFSPQQVSAAGGRIVGYGRIPGLHYTGQPAQLTSAQGGPGGLFGELFDPLGSLALPFLKGAGQTVGDVGTAVADLANVLATFEHWLSWLFVPSHWIRIICFVLGLPLVGLGITTMVKGAQPVPVNVGPVGTEVSAGGIGPAIGIVEVTLGAVLLFIAFHNLPPDVQTFPQLLSHVQSQVQDKTPAAPAPRPAVA